MKKDDRRRAAKAITPYGDRVKDATIMFLVKWVLLPALVIAVLVVLSLSKAPPQ